MRPGKSYAWEIPLLPTAYVVASGHRATLLIASQDSIFAADPDRVTPASPDPSACWTYAQEACYVPEGILPSATAGRAVNTVLTGPDGTYVELDWVDPALTTKAS